MNSKDLIDYLKTRSSLDGNKVNDKKLEECCKLLCCGIKENYIGLLKHLINLLNLKFVFVNDEEDSGSTWEDGTLVNYVLNTKDNQDMLPVFIAKALDTLDQKPEKQLHKTFKLKGKTLADTIRNDFILSGDDKDLGDREDKFEFLGDIMVPMMYFKKYRDKGDNKKIIDAYPNTCKFMEKMTSYSFNRLLDLYSNDEGKKEDLNYIKEHKEEFTCFTK